MMNLSHVEFLITAVVPGMLNSSSREKREKGCLSLTRVTRDEEEKREKSEDEGDSERNKKLWQTSRH